MKTYYQKLKKFFCLTIAIAFCILNSKFANTIYANDLELNDGTVTISIEEEEDSYRVFGNVSKGVGKQVSILVFSDLEHISYINQIASGDNGSYEFIFNMREEMPYGTYKVYVGCEESQKAEGVINYHNDVTKTGVRIDAGINITSFKPTISGTISVSGSKSATLCIFNKTNNTTIANENVAWTDGVFNFSYTLPSLLQSREYEIKLTSKSTITNAITSEASLNVSTGLLLSGSGTISLGGNTSLTGSMSSNKISSLNRQFDFSENRTFSIQIPNVAGFGKIDLSLMEQETTGEESITSQAAVENGVMSISGQTTKGALMPITIQIFSPSGQEIYRNLVTSNSQKQFSDSFTMPNDAYNGIYTVAVGGSFDSNLSENTVNYTDGQVISINSSKSYDVALGDKIKFFVESEGITDMCAREFVITYPANLLSLTDGCVFTTDSEITAGEVTDLGISISEISSGTIKFTVSDPKITQNKSFKGVINGIEFRTISGGTATVSCSSVE